MMPPEPPGTAADGSSADDERWLRDAREWVEAGGPVGRMFCRHLLELTERYRDRAEAAEREAAELRETCNRWLVAHDENMHLLSQGVIPPTEVKQAVHDGIKGIRAALEDRR